MFFALIRFARGRIIKIIFRFSELFFFSILYFLATLVIMSNFFRGMNKFFSQSTNDISIKRKPAAQRCNSTFSKLESGNSTAVSHSRSFSYKKLRPLSSLKEVSSEEGFATQRRNQSLTESMLLLNNEPELGYDFCEDIQQVDEASVADENAVKQRMAEDTPGKNKTVIHDSEPKFTNESLMAEAETRQERKMLVPGTAMPLHFKEAPDLKYELQKFQFRRKTMTETPEKDKLTALQEEAAYKTTVEKADMSQNNKELFNNGCNNSTDGTHPPVPKPRNNRQEPPQPLPRKLKCFEWKTGGRSCNNEQAQKHETSFTKNVLEHSPTTQVRSVSQFHREIVCFGEGYGSFTR